MTARGNIQAASTWGFTYPAVRSYSTAHPPPSSHLTVNTKVQSFTFTYYQMGLHSSAHPPPSSHLPVTVARTTTAFGNYR